MDSLNNGCFVIMHWNRIRVISVVLMSHFFSIYSAIVNVSFFMCLLSHCWSDCLHLQRSGSISVSVLLFLICFECSVDSAAKPCCFISSHVTYTFFFFFSTPTPTPTLPPTHILKLWTMWNAWDFLKHSTFAILIVICLFRPETRNERQNKHHFGHAQAHTPDERCTFSFVSPSNYKFYSTIHIHIPFGSFHRKKIESILLSCGL